MASNMTSKEYDQLHALLDKFGFNNLLLEMGDTGIIVSIEGDIGAGKSEAIRNLCIALDELAIPYVLAYEPVEEWLKTAVPNDEWVVDDESEVLNTLGIQYADPHARSLVQSNIYSTRVRVQRRAIVEAKLKAKQTGKKVVMITERSCISDKYIFASIGAENEHITQVGQDHLPEHHRHQPHADAR